MINNTHIINHKNTVINIRKEPKEKKYEANTAKIEKKKTYDFFQKKNSKSIQKNEKYRYDTENVNLEIQDINENQENTEIHDTMENREIKEDQENQDNIEDQEKFSKNSS